VNAVPPGTGFRPACESHGVERASHCDCRTPGEGAHTTQFFAFLILPAQIHLNVDQGHAALKDQFSPSKGARRASNSAELSFPFLRSGRGSRSNVVSGLEKFGVVEYTVM